MNVLVQPNDVQIAIDDFVLADLALSITGARLVGDGAEVVLIDREVASLEEQFDETA